MLSKNNIKILISIISAVIIYSATNMSEPSNNKSGNIIHKIFYHEEGTVCPFGIACGKLMIFLTIIQVYYLLNDKHSKNIKKINLVLLGLGILFSFMNFQVMIKIIPAFILQGVIIFW